MKDRKHRVEFFTFYDKSGVERHLEKMAAEGWLLEKMSALTWVYRRIEPKKIHFSVSFYASITDFEPEPTEEQQSFNDFCAHAGWKLAASSVQMQIFYNEQDNPVPIETDPMLEIENIHRYAKKTALVSYFCMLFLGVFMGLMFVGNLLDDPIELLASSTNLFTGIWWIVACVFALTELIGYALWRKKATAAAEQGVFLETRGRRKFGYAVVILLLISLVFYLLSLGNSGLQFFMCAYFLVLVSGLFLVSGVKTFLKKRKVKAKTNLVLTFVASFSLAFLVIGALNAITIYGIRNDLFREDRKELPITIGELWRMDDSHYVRTDSRNHSFLLAQIRSTQYVRGDSDEPLMSYSVTEVKAAGLYDMVVDQLYHQYDKWRSYGEDYAYQEINAEEWQALRAWELYRDGKPSKRYLVCYERNIIELDVDWELTADQKAIIFRKFAN